MAQPPDYPHQQPVGSSCAGLCLASGPLADNVNESLQRGHEVVVVGSFADDSYEKDGEKRRQQVLEAQVIALSLRFATADVEKTQRQGASSE